jgi:hypothetical protein
MSRWFRFYDEVLNDPKVQLLPPEKFKIWVNLLCLASKNDGVLPALDAVTFALRVTRDDLVTTLDQFRDAGLLDLVEVRDAPMSYEPHNWKERQYISDTKDPTGAERARRYRERHGRVTRDGRDANVSVTATRTDTESDSEADSDSEQKDISLRSVNDWPKDFRERFWKTYPRKAGKAQANRKLETIRKSGEVTFTALMAGVDRYASACLQIETQFQKHPITWLNAGCWDDAADALKRSTAPRLNGPRGFETLLFQHESPPDEPEYDIDLTANPAT